MKTTIQAIVMLCGAFGNGIVMIAAKANLFEQVDIYFLKKIKIFSLSNIRNNFCFRPTNSFSLDP